MASIKLSGANFDVDDNMALLIAKEREKFDSAMTLAVKEKEEAESKNSDLNSQLEKLQGELEATKTKLSELENMDHGQIVQDSIKAWNEVLPSIQAKVKNFVPDYSLAPIDVHRTYLKAVHDRENIFDKSDDFVAGVYDGLKPDDKTSGNLAKEKAIAQFHNLDGLEVMDGESRSAIEDARAKLIEQKESAYLNWGGK